MQLTVWLFVQPHHTHKFRLAQHTKELQKREKANSKFGGTLGRFVSYNSEIEKGNALHYPKSGPRPASPAMFGGMTASMVASLPVISLQPRPILPRRVPANPRLGSRKRKRAARVCRKCNLPMAGHPRERCSSQNQSPSATSNAMNVLQL